MKYLLLLVVLFLLWTAWQKRNRARREADRQGGRGSERPVEDMVACAHCGLLMPHSDSVGDGASRFCCEAHRQAGPRR